MFPGCDIDPKPVWEFGQETIGLTVVEVEWCYPFCFNNARHSGNCTIMSYLTTWLWWRVLWSFVNLMLFKSARIFISIKVSVYITVPFVEFLLGYGGVIAQISYTVGICIYILQYFILYYDIFSYSICIQANFVYYSFLSVKPQIHVQFTVLSPLLFIEYPLIVCWLMHRRWINFKTL